MKCMFCPIHSDDRRALAAHIRSAHEDKSNARRLAHAVEHGSGSQRSLVELQVTEVDIDACHGRANPVAG